MKKILTVLATILITAIALALLFTSFMLGAADGCADAGYDTFAIGEYGVYCLNQSYFEPMDEPVYTERDL